MRARPKRPPVGWGLWLPLALLLVSGSVVAWRGRSSPAPGPGASAGETQEAPPIAEVPRSELEAVLDQLEREIDAP